MGSFLSTVRDVPSASCSTTSSLQHRTVKQVRPVVQADTGQIIAALGPNIKSRMMTKPKKSLYKNRMKAKMKSEDLLGVKE